MKNHCEKTREKMKDLIFGTLNQRDKDGVTEHITECLECREYLRTLRNEQSMLREFSVKVNAGMERREEKMVEAIQQAHIDDRMERMMSQKAINPIAITKLAVAATLLVAAGYFAGRFLAPPSVNNERLRAELEPSIRRSVIEQINRDHKQVLEGYMMELKEQLARQFNREMNTFAARTLAASRLATEQRLIELIELIETARAVDHVQIASAFERLEANRLRDNSRFGEGLIRLTAPKNEVSGDKRE